MKNAKIEKEPTADPMLIQASKFRRERIRNFASWLWEAINESKLVSNQSSIEAITSRYNEKFQMSRQRISQILAFRNASDDKGDPFPSLPTPELVIGVATALGTSVNQALEAAGYRTDFGFSKRGAASELDNMFNQMSTGQQQLTLAFAKNVLQYLSEEGDQKLTPDEESLLHWYKDATEKDKLFIEHLIQIHQNGKQ